MAVKGDKGLRQSSSRHTHNDPIRSSFSAKSDSPGSDLCDCSCGQKETVKHVVLDCRLWRTERKEPRDSVRDKGRFENKEWILGLKSGRNARCVGEDEC